MNQSQSTRWAEVADTILFTLDLDWDSITDIIPKSYSIFDYGCGYGRNLAQLRSLGYRNLKGCDSCQGMIDRAINEQSNLDVYCNENLKTKEKSESYDCVILSALLTCLPHEMTRIEVITEAIRILKPGGVIYVAEFSCDESQEYDWEGCFDSRIGIRMKHFSLSEIQTMVSETDEISMNVRDVQTVGGEKTQSIHYLGKKPSSVITVVLLALALISSLFSDGPKEDSFPMIMKNHSAQQKK